MTEKKTDKTEAKSDAKSDEAKSEPVGPASQAQAESEDWDAKLQTRDPSVLEGDNASRGIHAEPRERDAARRAGEPDPVDAAYSTQSGRDVVAGMNVHLDPDERVAVRHGVLHSVAGLAGSLVTMLQLVEKHDFFVAPAERVIAERAIAALSEIQVSLLKG